MSGPDDRIEKAPLGRGLYLIASTSSREPAFAKSGERYSEFTKHLIEGIRSGSADINGDGLISANELYQYLKRRMAEEKHGSTPARSVTGGRGEIFIARAGPLQKTSPAQKTRAATTEAKEPEEPLLAEQPAVEVTQQNGVPTEETVEPPEAAAEPAERPVQPTLDQQDEDVTFVPGYTADNPFGAVVDLLDVEDEARAFARVAASQSIRPPLSIGIFGEWGSGKTFFMERMHEHVADLADIPAPANDDLVFHRDIVQIKFNAWHYIETNLWASLVEYIFHELDRWLRPKAPRRVDELFDQLSTSRQLKLEAIDELILKRQQEKEAEKKLDEAQRAYENALLRRSAVRPKEFWKAVGDTFKKELSQEDRKRIDDASRQLGFKELASTARELKDVMQHASEQAERAKLLGRSMVARLGRGRWLVALALLVLLVPVALILFKNVSFGGSEWAKQINDTVLGLSSLLTVLIGVIGIVARQASRALDVLQKFQDRLDAAIEERTKEPREDFAGAERQVALRQAAVEQAEKQLSDAHIRVDQAAREYESGTARGRLNQFIRDKVVDGDYAKHLGIIATIRKDFGQLAQIMSDTAEDDDSRQQFERATADYEQRVADILERDREHLTASEVASITQQPNVQDLKLFKRIILYIDDLDRCPPEKVVEVLQAIHLLLYFPLFVVVVAVDARWVSRSLKDQFPDLLQENVTVATVGEKREASNGTPADAEPQRDRAGAQNEPSTSDGRAASSQDYMEKIFQIPYWVRPMDPDSSKAYVAGITAPEVRGTQEDELQTAEASPIDDPGLPGEVEVALESTVDDSEGSGAQESEHTFANMRLTKFEAGFMEQLAPFVGPTPRRAIRFVNVYRLVKAGLQEEWGHDFVGSSGEALTYRALLTLLAIVTGAPKTARVFFEHLMSVKSATLADLRKVVGSDERVITSREAAAVRGPLDVLDKNLHRGAEMVAALRNLAPIAIRYSFTARPH